MRDAPRAETRNGRGSEGPKGHRAWPARVGTGGSLSPPGRHGPASPSRGLARPSPFWERIASPVLRSPNTDRGPSIVAAGHTSRFAHSAGGWRRSLSPAAATPAAAVAAARRGPDPSDAAGDAGNTAPPLPLPTRSLSPCAAAGQGGKDRRGGGEKREWVGSEEPEGRVHHFCPIRERIGRARR